MSLQAIIDIAERISIDRRKVVGIQYSRNEIPRISETPTRNPWKITISPSESLVYSDSRAILETLDLLDRKTPEPVTFKTSRAQWMFRYQGVLQRIQLNEIRVVSFIGNQLRVFIPSFVLNTVAVGSILFDVGDFVQITGSPGTAGYPYPFTVTSAVRYTPGQVVNNVFTITTHRPNFISGTVSDYYLNVGSECVWNMFCPNMPTYSLVPGAQRMNGLELINNARIAFDDDFLLYEYTATV